jgi:hypothetical protein
MDVDEDEIDLRLVFSRIWKMRKLILAGTATVVVISLMVNEFLGQYRSVGYFKINNVSPTLYWLNRPTILNADRFRAYAAKAELKDDESISFVAALVSLSPDALEQYAAVEPKEGKEKIVAKGDGNGTKVEAGNIGLDLKIPGTNPAAAQLHSQIFTEYFADSILYIDLRTWIESALQVQREDAYLNKIAVDNNKGRIEDLTKLLHALRTLSSRYPDAKRIEASQVFWLSNGNERFLSAVAQIVATERSIIDTRIELDNLQRKQEMGKFSNEFFEKATEIGSATISGREYLRKLNALRVEFFKSKAIALSDAANSEVMSEVSHQLQRREYSLTSGSKFLVGPTFPAGKTKKAPLMVAFGAGAVGLFLMIVLALLVTWWRENGKPHTEGDRAIASVS